MPISRYRGAFALLIAFLSAGCTPTPSSRPLFPVPHGKAWGFIDDRGKMIIAPRFEAVLPFSEGLAAAKQEGRWGYINREGKEAIPFRFKTADSFHHGMAIVDTGLPEHPVAVINSSGTLIVRPLFRSLSAADGPDGIVLGQKEAAKGFEFFDRNGNPLLGPYELAFPFAEGRARVRVGSNDHLIDAAGKFEPAEPLVLEGTKFSEGLIAIRRDRKLGYIDPDGKVAVEPLYDQGGEFSEGLAAVQSEGHWIFINKSGAAMAEFPAGIAHADPLSQGLSLVSADRPEGGRGLGYVDRSGRWVIPPVWDDAEPFHDGLARVGKWKAETVVYIDPTGKVVWEGR